jgi:hypothetical protein
MSSTEEIARRVLNDHDVERAESEEVWRRATVGLVILTHYEFRHWSPDGRSKPGARALGEIMDSVYTKLPIPGWPPL